jgi:molybdopterin molybdotransferase
MSELGPSPVAAGDLQLTVAQARDAILAAVRPVSATQTVGLADALERVLARDVISPIAVPAHDNSAMDGYAFAGAEFTRAGEGRGLRLRAVGTVFAGAPWSGTIGPGECLRIMTGAVMPEGLDTVVPLELCRVERGAAEGGADAVVLEPGVVKPGENRRRAGEDLAVGGVAVAAGRRLRPSDLGLIASLGIAEVTVVRRLTVAIFSTGDEIRTLGQPLDPGCVYDSNRFSLMAAVRRLGMEVLDLGLVRDDPETLTRVLADAAQRADAVITSGGVSAGDADHTREVLARLGQVGFWKVAMRPGRPVAFGPLSRGEGRDPALLFALPGNPVAALVTFHVLVQEALWRLGGASPRPLPVLQARAAHPIRKRPGRTEFQRAQLRPLPGGGQEVAITGSQGAGILRSMSEADCLLVLGHEQGSVAQGELVDVWVFDGLL